MDEAGRYTSTKDTYDFGDWNENAVESIFGMRLCIHCGIVAGTFPVLFTSLGQHEPTKCQGGVASLRILPPPTALETASNALVLLPPLLS